MGALLAARRIDARGVAQTEADSEQTPPPLLLKDFEPRSMLHVPETKVARSRYPVIDVHTHLSSAAEHAGGVAIGEKMKYLVSAESALSLMDKKNIRVMVDLTGGVGK